MNLHAAVVHFPIVLAFVGPAVDAVGFLTKRRLLCVTGLVLFGGALLLSVVATATGQMEYDAAYAEGYSVAVLDQHAATANWVPWVFLVLLGLRLWLWTKGPLLYGLGVLMTLLSIPLVVYVGHSGGELVYQHGVGVSVQGHAKSP